MAEVAIAVEELGKDYRVGERRRGYGTLRDALSARLRPRPTHRGQSAMHTALDEISFEVLEGETVGFIGHNGAGKTTILKILSRITEPTRGFAEIRGRVGALLEVGTGFHPELTGRENVFLNGAILGMTRRDITARFDEIVAFSGVERFLDTPVKHYSSGMTVRLAFSVAAHIDPEILLVDEVLAVGDASFQRRCLERLTQLAGEGRTVLFVSHNMAVIQGLCQRGIVLEGGRLREDAAMDEAIEFYLGTLERASATPLDERTDRQGAGPCRVRSIVIHGPDGRPPSSGSPVRFEVRIHPPDPTVTCAMTVYDSFGLPLVTFDSSYRSERDRTVDDETLFHCDVDALLLRPGRYRIDVGLQSGKHWHDAVHAAAYFDVEQGRVGGRPALADAPGHLLLEHAWSTPTR